MAKTYAIVSQKGGAGKTTTTVNLASAFALRKLKTLVIDLDPQGGSALGLGLVANKHYHRGVYDLLDGKTSMLELVIKTESPYLRFVPSGCFNAFGQVDRFQTLAKRLGVLKEAINSIRHLCDVILIDTPPGDNPLAIAALTSADSTIVPLQCEPLALRTLPQILRLIREVKNTTNPNLTIEGVLLTMYDVRYSFTEQVTEHVWNNFPRELVFETIIPRREDFSKSFIKGRTIVFEDPMATSSLSYIQFADELIHRISKELAKAAS